VIAAATPFASTAAAAPTGQPVARAAGGCRTYLMPRWHDLGPTYVEQLSVSNTTCATGANVIKSYNRCRLKAGGAKGSCHSTVLGFRCSEKRPVTSPVQFIAKVRCTKGREVVTFTYSENT
jgi:hypothetical protein